MVVTVSAWFYHFIFIPESHIKHLQYSCVICVQACYGLKSVAGDFLTFIIVCKVIAAKLFQAVEAVICNEVFSDFKKFGKFCLIIGNQKSSCGKNVNILKESPERIDFAVILRLILLWLNIIGISVRDFAKPRLCICGMDEVSLPV